MWQLNLPAYDCKIKKIADKYWIFDNQRKKYVRLTPEEWVRQHFIHYLIQNLQYLPALIAVEQEIKISGLKKRCDLVIYNQYAEPVVIAEFKSPAVLITQKAFDQIFTYNSSLQLRNFFVSNGLNHFYCHIDPSKQLKIETDIPHYSQLFSQK